MVWKLHGNKTGSLLALLSSSLWIFGVMPSYLHIGNSRKMVLVDILLKTRMGPMLVEIPCGKVIAHT
jgi:hypothetical protein